MADDEVQTGSPPQSRALSLAMRTYAVTHLVSAALDVALVEGTDEDGCRARRDEPQLPAAAMLPLARGVVRKVWSAASLDEGPR